MLNFKNFLLIFCTISFLIAPSLFSQKSKKRLSDDAIQSSTNSGIKRSVPFYLSGKQLNYVQKDLKKKKRSSRSNFSNVKDSKKEKKPKRRKRKQGKESKKKFYVYPWGAFAINMFLPFGVGSYLQLDFPSAVVQSVLDVTAIGFFIIGYFGFSGDRGFQTLNTFFADVFGQFNVHPIQSSLYLISLAAVLTSWVIGIITPWTFEKRKGSKLRRKIRKKKKKRKKVSDSIYIYDTFIKKYRYAASTQPHHYIDSVLLQKYNTFNNVGIISINNNNHLVSYTIPIKFINVPF